MRTKDEQVHVSPSARARDIMTGLIARHGLIQAVEIAQHIQAQAQATLAQQKRLHPEDWPAPAKTLPAIPKVIGGHNV